MPVKNHEDVKRLIGNSVSFLEAAKLIHGQTGPVFLWPPFYVNIYYAIELSFKAFLASRGQSRDQLKQHGHKLAQLSDACANLGLAYRHATLRELMTQIDGRLLEIRYLEGHDITVVTAEETIACVDQHIKFTALQIPIGELTP